MNRAFWAWNWYKRVISGFRVCFFNNCIEKNQNKTHFEEGTSESPPPLEMFWKYSSHTRDGSGYQNRWIFKKVLNGSWPPPPAPQNGPYENHVSFYLALVPPCIYATISIIKKSENEGAGSKAVWNFSENSSNMVTPSFPDDDNDSASGCSKLPN